MKRLLIVVAGALVAATAASAHRPPGFRFERGMSTRAAIVAKRTVEVYCPVRAGAWQALLTAQKAPRGATVYGLNDPQDTDEIYLNAIVCGPLRAQLAGRAVAIAPLARAMLTLMHEALHVRGIDDDGVAECMTMHGIEYFARSFGVTKWSEVGPLMRAAERFHRALPAQYHDAGC